MKRSLRLGVNVDHVATVRNARGVAYPDPVRAAKIAMHAGADGITAHLREDRRHIKDEDIYRLKNEIDLPLNFEMAATEEMLKIALDVKPNACCIVPEKREEVTTEGGLDVIGGMKNLKHFIEKLKNAGIRVSLFIDPEKTHVKTAYDLGADIVELHTGAYCNNTSEQELNRIINAAKYTSDVGIECHGGHGLDFNTAKTIAEIPEMVELNIGHFLIGESIFLGLGEAIKKMKRVLQSL